MHMHDARDVLFQECVHVRRAAEISVAGIEQETHLGRIGQRHQLVDIGRRFDIGAHEIGRAHV